MDLLTEAPSQKILYSYRLPCEVARESRSPRLAAGDHFHHLAPVNADNPAKIPLISLSNWD
jgi:hypothetical protein